MPGSKTYVHAAGFESLTRLYDLGVRLTMRPGAWQPWLVGVAATGRPQVILDVGCGTGTIAIELARRSAAEVVGVDGDPRVLELARRKNGSELVTFAEAMADDLPSESGSVDVAMSSLLLHHLAPATKRATLAEMHRTLRPGGLLLIADWGRPRDPLMSAAFTGLQLLDGFANTADHRRGLLPDYIEAAGFERVERIRCLRTVGGTFEIHRAVKPATQERR